MFECGLCYFHQLQFAVAAVSKPLWVNTGCADGMVVVGTIAFNPKEVLGHGSEGTFVYRFVFIVDIDKQHTN